MSEVTLSLRQEIDWYVNPSARDWTCDPHPGGVGAFHEAMSGYAMTPLKEVPALASALHVARFFVKDESQRFDLAAFKILGVSWALFRAMADRTGYCGDQTIGGLAGWLRGHRPSVAIAATDGNHGRAVARVARQLGMAAKIFVPESVPTSSVARITDEGALVMVVSGPYDVAVDAAAEATDADPAAVLIQDTAWNGYECVPGWTAEGYSTLFTEIDAELATVGVDAVDLMTIPVGVGALAQAAVTHCRSQLGEHAPSLLSVEPETADCVISSLRSGHICAVETGTTIMHGLNCGRPSTVAWPFLRDGLDAAITVTEDDTSAAIAELADLGIDSGASGAASVAAARKALTGPQADDRRRDLNLPLHGVVVAINTEGSVSSRDPLSVASRTFVPQGPSAKRMRCNGH